MGNTQPQRSNPTNPNPPNEPVHTRIPINLFDQPQNPDNEQKPLDILTNDCAILKQTFQLKHLENKSKDLYCLTFGYSSAHNVHITVYFQAIIEQELITGKIRSISLDPGAPHPKQYRCPSGLNQNFPDNVIKIEPELYGGVEKMTSHTDNRYPLIITIEPTEQGHTLMKNIYMFTFVANEKNEFTKVQLLKQKLEVGEESYEIDDIYLASADNPDTQTLNCGNATCIVCYTVDASVLLYPCRHFCLCQGCAQKVKQELKICPVCRKNVERFFPVQLGQKVETAELNGQS